MSKQLITFSLLALVLSSVWLLKIDAQAKPAATHSVSISQVLAGL